MERYPHAAGTTAAREALPERRLPGASGVLPPANRQCIRPGGDPKDCRTSGRISPQIEVQHQRTCGFERHRRPNRSWRKPKKKRKSGITLWKSPSTESLLSMCPFIALWSAKPLEEDPAEEARSCSTVERHGCRREDGAASGTGSAVQPGKWVDALVCTGTGGETGDLVTWTRKYVHTCCLSCLTLSACPPGHRSSRNGVVQSSRFSNLRDCVCICGLHRSLAPDSNR